MFRKIFICLIGLFMIMSYYSCQENSDTIVSTDSNISLAVQKPSSGMIAINVVLTTAVTDDILSTLGKYGKVMDTIAELKAVRILAKANTLGAIQALPFVEAANEDAERDGKPVDTVPVENFTNGFSTWNLDAVNVVNAPLTTTRDIPETGDGIYVAVLDGGLLDSWRQYFPQERIATEYAKSFDGGGVAGINVSEQPNKWEHDQSGHGTHVTSVILGYRFGVNSMNGVAPMARVIPVKVLNQNGRGWSSVIARGISYITELKKGPLADFPVVINMSLGGSYLDAWEKAAIDMAIAEGVIIVASAGNRGTAGMGYPGGYAPVISVAASGWIYEWYNNNPYWWYALNVADPLNPGHFYITDFSSRALPGQDLDVAAPGSWIVGPYQLQSGKTSYYFLGGTSQAAPHVAGIVALMLEKNPGWTASEVESKLESAAIPMNEPWTPMEYGWGLITADAALSLTP